MLVNCNGSHGYLCFLFLVFIMKVLTWNINGVRASKVSLKLLFDSLHADIICLQETKVTRDMLDEQTAVVEGYNSYFSFSRKRSGYSGVATYCKESVTPTKAEEGLSGTLALDAQGSVGCYGNHDDFSAEELSSLDAEGRAVITQHRIRKQDGSIKELAIINVYVPRSAGRDDRHQYKLQFLALLQTRAEALIDQGSHVIVLGDINTTHKKQDHCDPNSEEFLQKPSRLWMNQFLWEKDSDPDLVLCEDATLFIGTTSHTKGGMFIDAFRYFYPDDSDAFTNWCTLTAARQTNYGKRLDYIFVDTDLAKHCLADCTIMAEFEGSDHCPVVAELCCYGDPPEKCPPLCTKFMPEFSGKQQKLSSYFKNCFSSKDRPVSDSQNSESSQESEQSQGDNEKEQPKLLISGAEINSIPNIRKRMSETNSKSQCKKTKLDKNKSANISKQGNLMHFFQKRSTMTDNHQCEKKSSSLNVEKCNNSFMSKTSDTVVNKEDCQNSQSSESNVSELTHTSPTISPNLRENDSEHAKDASSFPKSAALAWKGLLGGPGKAPLCKQHKEPCVLRTVKKEGPNKGKQFYVCARGEGLKSNPESRCDHFQWIDRKKK